MCATEVTHISLIRSTLLYTRVCATIMSTVEPPITDLREADNLSTADKCRVTD